MISYREDNDYVQQTEGDLCEKMDQYCNQLYSEKGQHFIFRMTAHFAMTSKDEDASTRKKIIVETAANLILSYIQEMSSDKEV